MLRHRQAIFENDEEKQKLFETIKHYKKVSNYQLYGYCFVDNHVHLLIKETTEPLSMGIKRISVVSFIGSTGNMIGADIYFKNGTKVKHEIIKAIKSIDGVTVRQLSRITEVSKSTIDRK